MFAVHSLDFKVKHDPSLLKAMENTRKVQMTLREGKNPMKIGCKKAEIQMTNS